MLNDYPLVSSSTDAELTISKHVHALFHELNESGVKYFLLTDFESASDSRDIDLFVHAESKQAFEATLRRLGWFKRKEPSHHTNHHFYFSPHADQYLDVKIELSFAHGENDCYTYTNLDEALDTAIQNRNSAYRPKGIHAILLYAAHLGFKERGKLENKHKHFLSLYLNQYGAELADEEKGIATTIQKWLDEGFPRQEAQLRDVLSPYFSHCRKKMVRQKEYLKSGYGLSVLFLGTDGAGKTTLLEAVEEKLNLKTNRLYLGMGENGWKMSWLKALYYHRFSLKVVDKAISALISYVLLPTELLLRQLPVRLKSKYSVVLIDRVPGNDLIEKKPGKRFIYRSILPKPDIVIFLYATPEVLLKRKPIENTLERCEEDIAKFRTVAATISNGNYLSIDTSNLTIDEARDHIIAEIYKSQKVYDNLLTAEFN